MYNLMPLIKPDQMLILQSVDSERNEGRCMARCPRLVLATVPLTVTLGDHLAVVAVEGTL
jgi:hypothetical protein